MARPSKPGLSYFPKDVDVFSDRKIKILMARYGSDGYLFYDYLLCEIYRQGYYIQMDDDFLYLSSQDLNMSVGKIGQMLNFLLERSLLSRTLFQSDKVLTSAGIQRRYQLGVSTRARKNPVKVDARFWLLKEEETEGFIKVTHFDDKSENNPHFSKNNPSYSENYDLNKNKEEKNKLKESKEKEAISLSQKRFAEFWEKYPRKIAQGAAETAWAKIAPDEELFRRIMDALSAATYSEQWRKDNGQFIPSPAKWLNEKRWNDEREIQIPESPNEKRTYDMEAYESFDFLEPFSNSGNEDSGR